MRCGSLGNETSLDGGGGGGGGGGLLLPVVPEPSNRGSPNFQLKVR